MSAVPDSPVTAQIIVNYHEDGSVYLQCQRVANEVIFYGMMTAAVKMYEDGVEAIEP